jgi:hypothetical protein
MLFKILAHTKKPNSRSETTELPVFSQNNSCRDHAFIEEFSSTLLDLLKSGQDSTNTTFNTKIQSHYKFERNIFHLLPYKISFNEKLIKKLTVCFCVTKKKEPFIKNTSYFQIEFSDGSTSLIRNADQPAKTKRLIEMRKHFRGNEFERDQSHYPHEYSSLRKGFWSEDWKHARPIKDFYDRVHSLARAYCDKLYSLGLLSESHTHFCDAGSGKGDLIASLCSEFPPDTFPDYAFVAIDSDQASCIEAREHVLPGDNRVYIECDTLLNLHSFFSDGKKRPNILFFFGILAHQVLPSREIAYDVLSQGFDVLEPQEICMISQMTKNFLWSDDFSNIGFNVVNSYVPEYGLSFYILQKPDQSSKLTTSIRARKTVTRCFCA